MSANVETIIGTDEYGREYLAVYRSVYRMEGYGASGAPIGTWVSELTPFLATGAKLYRVVVDGQAVDEHYRLLDITDP